MRKIIVLLMCMQLVFPNAWANLCRVNTLVTHYLHHHRHLSLLDFIALHYFDKEHSQTDKEHKELPFHHQGTAQTELVFYFTLGPGIPAADLFSNQRDGLVKHFPTNEHYPDMLLLDCIWQPPKAEWVPLYKPS